MPFSIRPYRRFPVQCSATYNAGPFQGQGLVWVRNEEYGVETVVADDATLDCVEHYGEQHVRD